ncbi:DUF6498-containing protein [Winogradskyella luteola]|uniref:Uncharacterized protein n=1 Tax=Winogradskyella luteola TaxID=2828330 RepID=A0A9X1F9Q5_9FLAO|nr:DUF6498-containing protein [Winogradskyella luteola]MBV7269896.1 hypothetical protein [Winogradskyella luteola]
MLKSVFYPNTSNAYAWANTIFLIAFIATGKIEAYAVLFGYFLETIIIGVANIVKMLMSYKGNDNFKSIVGLSIFFVLHYGGFIAVQSIFLFAIFSLSGQTLISEPFDIIKNFNIVLELEGMLLVVMLLIGTQLIKLVFDFIIPKKYLKFKVTDIMFKPYFRIVIQQFTVIIASFFILFSAAPIFAAILLVVLRSMLDFIFVAIKADSYILDFITDKLYNGKGSKEYLKEKILLFTE